MMLKNTLIEDDYNRNFRFQFKFDYKPLTAIEGATHLLAWEGEGDTNWIYDENRSNFVPGMRPLCKVEMDTSRLLPLFKPKLRNGVEIWALEYKLRVFFGGGQIKAHTEWREGQTIQKGPATIVPSATFDPQMANPER